VTVKSENICIRAIPFIVWASLLGGAAGQTDPIQTGAPKPVKVESGQLRGTVEDGLAVYRGIPYAAPPVGELRSLGRLPIGRVRLGPPRTECRE
jgi:Carboxylesterase family